MSNGTTTGLLAELRQQDLLREAASVRLVPAGATAPRGHGLAAQIRRRLPSRILRIIHPASADLGPRSQPEHPRQVPGRA